MATIEHNTLTGSDLHEPKDAATAAAGAIYTADGLGSGAWTVPAVPVDSYGAMTVTANTNLFTPVSADLNQYKLLNNIGWTDAISEGITINADGVNDDITLQEGTYAGTFYATISTNAANSSLFGMKYGIDGVLGARSIRMQKNSTGTDTLLISVSGIFQVTVGQKLSVHLSSSVTTDLTIIDAGLSVHRIAL